MSKKRPKENTHQFPKQIELAIQSYCETNLNTYNPKDITAYANKVYSDLDNKFYEADVWEKNYSSKNKQKALVYISNYVGKYIPEYQKQSSLSILSLEEQQAQLLLQKYNSHNKYTEPLKESNSEEVNNQIIALDAMSRLFVKNPYSSLVRKVGEDNILYLGVNSNETVMSLKKMNEKNFTNNSNVLKIVTAFYNYILEQNSKNIQELLQCLQNDMNPILGNILKVLKITPDVKVASLRENQQKGVLDKLINETEIKFITQYGFHNSSIIESYPYGHAEMNGLAHARGLHSGNVKLLHNESPYIIGLASANYGKIDIKGQLQGTQPFSCMGCSAEIEVLKKEENLDISIGYTSIDSMQYSEYYRPSLNIIFNSKLTEAWCKEIELSISKPQIIKEKRQLEDRSILSPDYYEEKKRDAKEIKFKKYEEKEHVEDVYKYCKGSLQGFLFEYHQRDLQDIKEVLQGKVNIMMPGQANPDFENYPDTIFLQLILGGVLENNNYQYSLRIHCSLEHNKQLVIESVNKSGVNFGAVEDQDYIEAVGTHPLTSITILQLKQSFAQAEQFLQGLTTVEDNPYLDEMAKDGTWGGETELGAIAEINNLRQIFIYNQQHELINSTVINENGDQTIYLQRVNDNHYNAYIGVASEDTFKEIPGGGNCMFAAVLYAIDVDYRGKDKKAQLNDIKQLRQQVVDTIKVTLQNDPDLIARQFKLLFDSESKGMFLYRLGDLPPTDLRAIAINIHKELQKSLTGCNIGIILTNQEESSNFLEDMIIMNFLHQDNTLKKLQKNNSKLLNEEELELQKAIEESLKSGSFEENIRQAKVEYHNKILKVMTNIDNYEAFSQKLNLVKINCTEDFENLKKASLENIEEIVKNIKNKDVIIPRLNLLQSKSNEEEELYGIDQAMHGLTPKDIQINLADIVKANLQTDFYIRPNIMEQEELLLNLNEWHNMQDGVSLYAALVKVTNQAGVKHAILLSAQQTSGKVQITITEPLAKEDSTFGTQLNELHNALKAQGFDDVAINYAGTQDKNYGTCADMSLIMLQELIEQTANKLILDTCTQTIVNNFGNNHINYENTQSHNFDYVKSQQIELIGQDHHDTI